MFSGLRTYCPDEVQLIGSKNVKFTNKECLFLILVGFSKARFFSFDGTP
jgi:hypothetical protein